MSRIAALIWTAAFAVVAACPSVAQQTDAISREVSVCNNQNHPIMPADAVSREISVSNIPVPVIAVADAISREVAIFNDLKNPVVVDSAESREVSANNAFGCSGNFTADGLVTPEDIPPFVNVLIGVVTDPFARLAADVNCDGMSDARDIAPFVELAVTP